MKRNNLFDILKESPPEVTRSGRKIWRDNQGRVHRDNDRPAIIDANGDQMWYNAGDLHRENDLPAITQQVDKYTVWYTDGKLHRENDLPALIGEYGYKAWYKNGVRHRDNDKPAIIYEDGSKGWYINGELMRLEP